MLRAPGRILLARSCVLVGRNLTCTLSPLKSPASHHDGRRALWVWGNGDFGKHGTGGEADAGVFAHEILEPEPLEGVGLKPDLLQEVAAGGAHTLLVTVTGRLLSCGLGETGQLGRGDLESESFLDDVEGIGPVLTASCGYWHSAAVTRGGELYTWGSNQEGQLGAIVSGGGAISALPLPVSALAGANVKQAACGARHTLAVTAEGEVYSWGLNHEGQLGHGGRESLHLPKRVAALRPYRITHVAAGWETSAAVSEDGKLFVWGMGRWGQLGTADRKSRDEPVEVQAAEAPVTWKTVALGDFHAAAVTSFGELYTWGNSLGGALGLGDGAPNSVTEPIFVREPRELRGVRAVACGARHTLALTKLGDVFAMGLGEYGRLGQGHDRDLYTAERVPRLIGKSVRSIAAGISHSVAF